MKNLLLPVLAVCLLASCNKEPLTSITPPSALALGLKDSVFVISGPVDQTVLLDLINSIRSKGCNCGDVYMPPAPPLTWNIQLERASWLHSKEMSDSCYMGHTGKNGSGPGDRLRRMGYAFKICMENIAMGALTEQSVMKGWMSSAVHCKALMNADIKETGVAKYKNFWTQELALKY